MTKGEIQLSGTGLNNYITMNGISNYNHHLKSTASAGHYTIDNETTGASSTIQGHCIQLNQAENDIYIGTNPDLGDDARIMITTDNGFINISKPTLITLSNPQGDIIDIGSNQNLNWQYSINIQRANGEIINIGSNSESRDLIFCCDKDGSSAAMQGGRFVCSDSNGEIVFDSDDFKQ